MKKYLKISLGVLGGVLLLLLVWKFAADATYFNDYDSKLPFNESVVEVNEVNDTIDFFGITRPRHYRRVVFRYQSRPGEMVPALLTFPAESTGKVPCIVFLHGIGQSKKFLDEITTPFNEAGFAMVTFDQHMQGERDVKGVMAQAVAFRKRPWKTINDTRRLIDYLETHPDIDSDRIYLIGASYGAITGCTAVAFDKRIKAAIMVVGGGNIPVLLDAPLIKNNAPRALYMIAKPLVGFLMRPADPIRYAAKTAPTPMLFQNGDQDTLVTPAAGKELFNAAGEPKEIRWYPCDHPGLVKSQAGVIVAILDEGLQWLIEKDLPFRKTAVDAQKSAV
jgi:hypothetical protein